MCKGTKKNLILSFGSFLFPHLAVFRSAVCRNIPAKLLGLAGIFDFNILNLRLQGLRCGEEGCIIVAEDAFVFCGIGEYFQEYRAWALGGDEGVDALLHLLLILCLEIGDVVLQTDAFG